MAIMSKTATATASKPKSAPKTPRVRKSYAITPSEAEHGAPAVAHAREAVAHWEAARPIPAAVGQWTRDWELLSNARWRLFQSERYLIRAVAGMVGHFNHTKGEHVWGMADHGDIRP